ncbi:MAG TPA: cyanophycinase [Gemmatimonadales bacterium]|nr:cyanophycinase [Gemmatimonadales bacterium]
MPGPAEQRRPVEGRLIIIGGHEDREGGRLILREVADCADGRRLVVCTVASDVPEEVWEDYRRCFAELGCRDVVHLDIGERTDILEHPPLELLDGAGVVFFTGGGQLRITTRFSGTRLCAAIEELYWRGATIAGTSAGASVMADTMLVAGTGRESHKIGENLQMAPGLGYLKDVIIDQHFAERGRIGRLLGAVAQNPRLLGIGLDEDTAIVVEREERFAVLGSGAVYVADAQDVTYTNIADEERDRTLSIFDVRLHLLSQGDAFDLRPRRPRHRFASEVEQAHGAAHRDGGDADDGRR